MKVPAISGTVVRYNKGRVYTLDSKDKVREY
jgi:hypothetical protein